MGALGLVALTRVAEDLYKQHKLRNPGIGDFSVRKRKVKDGTYWYVQHRHAMDVMTSFFDSKEDAERAVPLVVLELRIANPKTSVDERDRLMQEYAKLVDALSLRNTHAWLRNSVTARGARGVPYFSLGFITMEGVCVGDHR